MPNFNYDNPRNIDGKSMESGEDQLFLAVMDILAEEGYGGISAENLKTRGDFEELLKTYGSLEELCEAALKDAAERIRCSYESITEDARSYLKAPDKTRDQSYMHLERLLYRHIYLCFHPKNRKYVLACAQENHLPQSLREILPKAAREYFGDVLAELILEAGEVRNAQMAALMACSICGSIQTFVQQPRYCKEVFMKMTKEEPNYAVIEDFLNNMFLRMIAANTQINKPF